MERCFLYILDFTIHFVYLSSKVQFTKLTWNKSNTIYHTKEDNSII